MRSPHNLEQKIVQEQAQIPSQETWLNSIYKYSSEILSSFSNKLQQANIHAQTGHSDAGVVGRNLTALMNHFRGSTKNWLGAAAITAASLGLYGCGDKNPVNGNGNGNGITPPAPVVITANAPSTLYAGIDEGAWSAQCSSTDGLASVEIDLRTPGGVNDLTIREEPQANSYSTSFTQVITQPGTTTLDVQCTSNEEVTNSNIRTTTIREPTNVTVRVQDTDSRSVHESLQAYLVTPSDSLVSADGVFNLVLTKNTPIRVGLTRQEQPFSYVRQDTLYEGREEHITRVVDYYLRDVDVHTVVGELRAGEPGVASPQGFYAWVEHVYSREGPGAGEVGGVRVWNRDYDNFTSSTPGTINRFFESKDGIGPDEILLPQIFHIYTNTGPLDTHKNIDRTKNIQKQSNFWAKIREYSRRKYRDSGSKRDRPGYYLHDFNDTTSRWSW